MGSRDKPNHGGSGLPHSRKSRPKPAPRRPVLYRPIETAAELELYLSGDKIACLLCGEEFKSLGHHLSRSHAMSSWDYKVRFNIPVTRSLSGLDLRSRKSAMMETAWLENPKMERVRVQLKANIHNLDGTKHKTRSSVAKEASRANGRKLKAIQDEQVRVKFRAIYIDQINESIASGVTLYAVAKNTHQIYAFARRFPEDREFSDLLALTPPVQRRVEFGAGLVERFCVSCGAPFMTRHDRDSRCCSKACAYAQQVVRLQKTCVICGTVFSVVPSKFERLSSCGSAACKRERAARSTRARYQKSKLKE